MQSRGNKKWIQKTVFLAKSFSEGHFFVPNPSSPPQHLWERGVAQGDISPTCCQQRRRQRPLFSAQVRMIMRSKTDGSGAREEKVLYIAQPELKWVCTRVPLYRGKLGSGRPPAALLLRRGVRGADSLKIHLWQQSNKWLRLYYSLPVVIHHSASSNCMAPRSLFIILPQSLPRPPHLLPEGGKKKTTKVISSRKKRSSYFFLYTGTYGDKVYLILIRPRGHPSASSLHRRRGGAVSRKRRSLPVRLRFLI